MDKKPRLSNDVLNIAKYALERFPDSEVTISGIPSPFISAIFISGYV